MPSYRAFNWSDVSLGIALSLWNDGRSSAEISAIFDRKVSAEAIIGKFKHAGIAYRPSPGVRQIARRKQIEREQILGKVAA